MQAGRPAIDPELHEPCLLTPATNGADAPAIISLFSDFLRKPRGNRMRTLTITSNATMFLAQGPLFFSPLSLSLLFPEREICLSIRFFAVISYISFDLRVGEV